MSTTPHDDMITPVEGAALLRDTGHPRSKDTIQRWVREGRLERDPQGLICASELAKVHRDTVMRSVR